MRFLALFTLSTVLVCAATPADTSTTEDPDVMRARLSIERLRALVDAGAIPRVQLEQAQDALGDAQDMAVLRRAMYSTDLTEAQADEMVAAAKRRLDRRQKKLDQVRGLIDSGIAARNDLGPLADQVEFARKEYDLAVTRADLCHQQAEMARVEQLHQWRPGPGAERGDKTAVHYEGAGVFTPAEFAQVAAAFEHRFSKPLPVSAMGETAVHRAMGFDHRGRVDVALNPDQPEGVWLRQYLEARRIPYFAFWHAAAGKATGAHIHIGPESTRLTAAAD
ncbi:MAG TPA: hypothetical protein VMT86_12375 [Bryobacteraceae bacterium]|nr:hypothetical protein [Bryobacteraceae bacterium]